MRHGALYHSTTFDYNGLGQRTGKHYRYDTTVGSTNDLSYTYDTEYYYDDAGRLMREVCTEHYMHGTTTVYELIYLYNESGMIGVRLSVNGGAFTDYYYHRNALGDVIAIYNTSYTRVVEYAYDAWGNCTTIVGGTTAIGQINPILYRGYYRDRETGFYYLNARYYDPSWRRFISPDDTAYLDPEAANGLNLYAYCGNDPVNYADPSGCSSNSLWKTILGVAIGVGLAALAIGATILTGGSFAAIGIGFVLGATASFVGQGVGNVLSGENFFDGISIGSIIMGGLAGAAFATGVGGLWGAVAIGAASNAGTSALENKSWANIAGSAVVGGIAAGIGYGVGKFASNHIYKNTGMTFNDFYNLGIVDMNPVMAAFYALGASWYTFLPNIATSSSRGLIKFLGNKGIGWF